VELLVGATNSTNLDGFEAGLDVSPNDQLIWQADPCLAFIFAFTTRLFVAVGASVGAWCVVPSCGGGGGVGHQRRQARAAISPSHDAKPMGRRLAENEHCKLGSR